MGQYNPKPSPLQLWPLLKIQLQFKGPLNWPISHIATTKAIAICTHGFMLFKLHPHGSRTGVDHCTRNDTIKMCMPH